MGKRVLTALLSAIILLGLCGCGSSGNEDTGDKGNTTETTKSSTEQTVEDTAWALDYKRILEDVTVAGERETDGGGADVSYVRQYLGEDFQFDGYFLEDVDQSGIPELYICQKNENLILVINHNGDRTVNSGIFGITHLNKEEKEWLEHGHWHGSGGSGDNEWVIYKFDEKGALNQTLYFDYGTPEYEEACIYDPVTQEHRTDASMDEYQKLYDKHAKNAVEISKMKKYDMGDMSAFNEYGVTLKDVKATNEQKIYNSTIEMITDAVNTGNADNDNLPFDLKETIYNSGQSKPSVFYALKDLDQNGVQELIIGTAYNLDPAPIGIYTIKDNEPYLLSELSFFGSILSDGTINSLQGNGVPDGNPNGYFFKLKGTELEEVQAPGTTEEMEFDWIPIT